MPAAGWKAVVILHAINFTSASNSKQQDSVAPQIQLCKVEGTTDQVTTAAVYVASGLCFPSQASADRRWDKERNHCPPFAVIPFVVSSSFGDVACRMNDIDSANIVPSIYTLWQHALDSRSFILSNRLLPFQQDAMPSISQRKQPTCLEGSGKPKGFASWFEIVGASSSFKANEVASFRQKILADDVSILYLHVHSYNSLTVTVLDLLPMRTMQDRERHRLPTPTTKTPTKRMTWTTFNTTNPKVLKDVSKCQWLGSSLTFVTDI